MLLEFCVQIAIMRKRSKYRPKGVLVNPLGYVLESLTPVKQHESFLLDLKIKNHGAMTALTKGYAEKHDIEVLISMINMTEALHVLGFGKEYAEIIKAGLDALTEIGRRGAQDGRFIVKAYEMTALNTALELHDAQMDVTTIKDIERAIAIIEKEFRHDRVTHIVETGEVHV